MNIYVVNIIVAITSILFGYLVGGIPTGVIIGKVFFKKDPRDYGSKNIGGANTARVFGIKVGIIVTVLDMLKTAIVIYSVWALTTYTGLRSQLILKHGFDARPLYYYSAGFFACIGHSYSPYLDFKGGKAVACFMSLCCLTSWVLAIIALIFFAIVFITKIVSISSLISGFIEVISAWVIVIIGALTDFNTNHFMWTFFTVNGLTPNFFFALFITYSYVILVIRHRSNIKRLAHKEENKLFY